MRERSREGIERRRFRSETEKQRWDRNFGDLLQELRVAQAGVQILFAFLLTLPFSAGFPHASAFQRDVYVVALLTAAASAAMLISPVAFHRALFRQGRKPELVRYAYKMLTGGLNWYRALNGGDLGSVRVITVPTTYIWPDRDGVVARTAALRTRDWVEGGYQLVVLRGISHWAPEQAPEAVADAALHRITGA